jgi:hypothetical protein
VVAGCVPAVLGVVPPGEWKRVGEPTWLALAGFLATVALIAFLEAQRHAPLPLYARIWFAGFLAGMPGIYIAMAHRHGASHSVELLALALFGACAVAGVRRPALLVYGIAAHGLLWDSWHFGRTEFMPDWYAAACAMVDLALGFWLLSRTTDS